MPSSSDCDPRYLRYVNSRNERFKNYEFVRDRPSSKVGKSLTPSGHVDTTVTRRFYRRSESRGRSRSRSRRRRRSGGSRGRRSTSRSSRSRSRTTSRSRSRSRAATLASGPIDSFVRRTPAVVYGSADPSSLRPKRRRSSRGRRSSASRTARRGRRLPSEDDLVDDDDYSFNLGADNYPASYRRRARRRRRNRPRLLSSSSDSEDEEQVVPPSVSSSSSSLLDNTPTVTSVEYVTPDDRSDRAQLVRDTPNRAYELARFEPLNPSNRGTGRGGSPVR